MKWKERQKDTRCDLVAHRVSNLLQVYHSGKTQNPKAGLPTSRSKALTTWIGIWKRGNFTAYNVAGILYKQLAQQPASLFSITWKRQIITTIVAMKSGGIYQEEPVSPPCTGTNFFFRLGTTKYGNYQMAAFQWRLWGGTNYEKTFGCHDIYLRASGKKYNLGNMNR